jgi:type III secretion system YscD/HrpQ family protein
MAAKLVAEEGVLKGLVLNLDEGDQWVIGRDPDASQLIVEDSSVSRRHALCRKTDEGMVIENLSSTNPILINDAETNGPTLLHNGDSVKIGNGVFRFYSEPSAQLVQETTDLEEILPPESHETPHAETVDTEELHNTIYEENTPEDKAALAEINFDLTETGRWLLKVIGGPNNGAEYTMQTGNSYLVGTDPNSCDVIFHDNSVSRQHCRISINEDDSLSIEDLKSRNNTLVDGKPLEGKQKLIPNSIVTTGTTSFVVYDREGEMQTIISPLLPSIVKFLQQDEARKAEEEATAAAKKEAEEEPAVEEEKPETPKEPHHSHLGAFLLLGIISGLMVIIGLGVTSLMRSEPVVVQEQVDTDAILKTAMANFPDVKYQFIKPLGRLNLVGHVLTASDKNELLYNLQGLSFIKSIDDKDVVIDQGVAGEINQVLAKNPAWRGISVQVPEPGHFVLSGYLQSRKQAEQIWDYISNNFSYLDLLDRRMIVEEDVIIQANQALQQVGLRDITAQMSNGELTLSGNITQNKAADLNKLLPQLQNIQGVRAVKNFVVELQPEQSMINVSDRYEVTGFAQKGGVNMNVVINGRVLSRGDSLDGMVITSIKPNVIFLEKDGVKYRIDYNR